MNRRHKLIFIALSLFPFVLAMSFRAVDNYQFALERQKHLKSHPDYYPPILNVEEIEKEFTCHQMELSQDSLNSIRALSE